MVQPMLTWRAPTSSLIGTRAKCLLESPVYMAAECRFRHFPSLNALGITSRPCCQFHRFSSFLRGLGVVDGGMGRVTGSPLEPDPRLRHRVLCGALGRFATDKLLVVQYSGYFCDG